MAIILAAVASIAPQAHVGSDVGSAAGNDMKARQPAAAVQPAAAAKKPTGDPFAQRLDAAIAQVPGASSATWIVADRGGWAATDLATGVVYVSPHTPANRLLDVVRHEWVHVQQGRVYGGFAQADKALAPLGGIEVVADCGARTLGAGWTKYIKHCSPQQTAAATSILAGRTA